MTRKRVTASEKKQRHEWAVRQIDRRNGSQRINCLYTPKHGGAPGDRPVMSFAAGPQGLVTGRLLWDLRRSTQRDLLFQQVGRW